jgi:uncharacterized protein YqfB (UPF0267 family)
MSKITTEDCKNFIKNHFGLTSTVNIKRDRKYKDGNGDVIRVFKFNDETCFIKADILGHLSIVNEADIVEKAKSDEPKEFNAKSFIKKYIKKLENDDDYDTMDNFMKETAALSSENKVKVANEFYFYFPDMTYHNEAKYVVNGLDTPMIGNNGFRGSSTSFCIWFYDSLDSEPDLYVSDILNEVLPSYFDKVDEYHFEIDETSFTKTLTIKDMIELLEHFGFRYKNHPEAGEEGCMLKKLNLK